MKRLIAHVDMDAFFASVEQLLHPEWRGKPVIVGADPKKGLGRGVVSAASYEARKYGVHSAMPVNQAYKRCPHGIFTRGHMQLYQEYSNKIFEAFDQLTPLVEPLSIDEAFLDMTGTLKFYSSPQEMGMAIKQKVKEVSGLTCSVGIAPNKSVAKIASDLNKPDGLVVVTEENLQTFMADLPITRIWGIGKKSAEVFTKLGITTCKDLWEIPYDTLITKFGKLGDHIYRISRGIDDRPVETRETIKSISNERTFGEDVGKKETLLQTLLYLSEKVAFRMKKYGFIARTVVLKLRYSDFETHTKNITLPEPVKNSNDIYRAGESLLSSFSLRKKVRLLGIGVSGLISAREGFQMSIFDTLNKKDEKIDRALESIRKKFGDKSIVRAENIHRGKSEDRNESH
ncbi:MAG: DNA polymerase IV [Calditrichia bacterium]